MSAVTVDVRELVVVEIVCIPEGLSVVVAQPETVEGFGEAVNVVVWHHGCDELEELVFKNDFLAISAEDSLARPDSGNLELKAGIVAPGEG